MIEASRAEFIKQLDVRPPTEIPEDGNLVRGMLERLAGTIEAHYQAVGTFIYSSVIPVRIERECEKTRLVMRDECSFAGDLDMLKLTLISRMENRLSTRAAKGDIIFWDQRPCFTVTMDGEWARYKVELQAEWRVAKIAPYRNEEKNERQIT